ncbi:MAG: 4-hydroxy-3-methylbut-2-enyl diphosphate reductase [Mariprofundaceae bacterium]|nr:4-hydroxy-3-methylbut-2-enyl diphosphate reductase [Mariprofundaceae bacterium]
MKVILAQPRGFCAGVDRAIEIVEKALELFGTPVYVRHEIVHNKYVVDSLRNKGAVFVDEVEDTPANALLIFSAHGVSQEVRHNAQQRGLHIVDATCPLVTKVHLELIRHHQQGRQIILIGHAGHPEVIGTLGQVPEGAVLLVSSIQDIHTLKVHDETKLAYVTQTTLSMDDTLPIITALQQHFPKIQAPKREDICYATSNRQLSVKELAKKTNLILVIGSPNSSNSQRLCETAKQQGVSSWLIENATEIKTDWLKNIAAVGVTAGASAPELLVQEVVDRLMQLGGESLHHDVFIEENVFFPLPKELRIIADHES